MKSQLKKILLSRKKSFCISPTLGQWNDIKKKEPERQEGIRGPKCSTILAHGEG